MAQYAIRKVGALPVANVQALAEAYNKGDEQAVPERYLMKDPDAEVVVPSNDSNFDIPIIDFSKLLDPESSQEESAKLASACLHWGFFHLINHGVPDEVIGNLKKDVTGFLKQPLEVKKECGMQAGSLEGYGQAFVFSDDQKLEWADMLHLIVHPRESRDMRFWPTRPASFMDSVDAYTAAARKLGYRLLELMSMAVGADPAALRDVYQGQPQGMKVNFYPPCRQEAGRVMGLSAHTDASGLTLLLQMNNDVEGLQVMKDGKWFTVNVVDGAFVVNVGDVLEFLSNGKFTSVEHRAVVHPTKERTSVALFFYPNPNTMVGPLPEFVKGAGNKARYRSNTYQDYMKHYFANRLDGRKHVEVLMLEQ